MSDRILYICGGRSFCAKRPGRKIASVVDCWRRLGYDVLHVCGGDIPGHGGDDGEHEYGAMSFHQKWYRRVGVLAPLIRSVSESRDIRHNLDMIDWIEGMLRSFSPVLIWERSCRLHDAGLVMARQLGVPYVLEWKDNIASYRFSRYRTRARKLEARKNREADFIVTESDVLRRELVAEGLPREKILVAHNAVDPHIFCPNADARPAMRRQLGIRDDEVVIGYAGSYAWYHDVGRLIQALQRIRERRPGVVRGLMVGQGQEYEKACRLAANSGLLDTVNIIPGVPPEQVPAVLAAMDIAVLPGSTPIICPVKIQEYMAAGLPTMAPDYECNREVIDDGRTGALFVPGSSESLAERILMLAQDREMRASLGREARREVVRRFTWEQTWGSALQKVLCQCNRAESRSRRSA